MRELFARTLVAGFIVLGMSQRLAAQDSVSNFYAGKQIRILVGFGPGGSSSLYSQSLARHLGRHLPGNPTITAQNMPGAGGLLVANHMNTNAPRDGTVLAITSRTAIMEPLLGNVNARFDPREFGWLGNATPENSVCVSWHTSPVRSVEDIFKKELVVGGTGADAIEVLIPKALNNLLGTKFKMVTGFPASTDVLLALEREEVSGFCALSWATATLRKPELLREKKLNILFQISLKSIPELAGIPLIQDLAKTEDQRQVLEFLTAPQELGRTFFTTPGVPEERLAALRKAFMATMSDPAFLEEAAKQGLEVNPVDGAEVQRLVEKIYMTSKGIVEKGKAASQGNVSR